MVNGIYTNKTKLMVKYLAMMHTPSKVPEN